jgi:hypothetical protein
MSVMAGSGQLMELHMEECVCMDENGHFAFRNFYLYQSTAIKHAHTKVGQKALSPRQIRLPLVFGGQAR